MKKLIGYSSGLALAVLMTGCVGGGTPNPIMGSLYTDVYGPVGVTSNSGGTKMGEATATGILGFATGDASVKTAAANGGITKISHVDHHITNVLGIWGKTTTIVYGD